MSETLSFPGLGLEFDIDRVAFKVFGLPIYWYGVIIACAFLLAAIYVMRRVKTFGLDGDRLMDVILGGVVLGIVCARLYYVIFSWDTYADDPISVFYLRKGGLAIYGGVIGAVVAALLICRWRKVKFLPAMDLGVGGLLIGQGIGRWGNFVNIEAFGSNTALPWGMHSNSIEYYLASQQARLAAIGVTVDPSMPVHPTFLYESVWCLLGFLFIALYTKHRRFDGELSLVYIGWYGLGRFFIEGLRTDPLLVGTVRVSQILALLCVLASLIAMIVVRSKIRRANDPEYLKLFVNTPDGQSIVAGTFYPKKGKAADDAAQSGPAAQGGEGEREETGAETPQGDIAGDDNAPETQRAVEDARESAPAAADTAPEGPAGQPATTVEEPSDDKAGE